MDACQRDRACFLTQLLLLLLSDKTERYALTEWDKNSAFPAHGQSVTL